MLQQITPENFIAVLGRFSTNELENLIQKFPYFHQAHLLLAKKYQLERNDKFDEQLQLAALYTQDRDMFFSIFNKEELKHVAPFVPVIEETQPFILLVIEEEKALTQPITAAPVYESTEEEVVTEHPIIDFDKVETIEVAAAEPEKIELTVDEIPVVIETPNNAAGIEIEEVKVETPPAREQIVAGEKVLIYEEVKVEEEAVSDGPRSFDDWLHAYAPETTFNLPSLPNDIDALEENPKTVDEQDDELDKLIMQSVPVNLLHDRVEEETHYSRGLDEFIEEQIQKRKQVEVKKPVSENEIDPDSITETLAKLYEMQKKYTKAIKAYETLGLKYPEKSDFFNARISFIKSLI